MICHVARRSNGFKRPVLPANNVAIGHNMVGLEGVIGIFFETRPIKSFWLGWRAPVNRGFCARLQRRTCRRMVKMGMRYQNMTDALVWFQRVQNRINMVVQQRARINDGDIAARVLANAPDPIDAFFAVPKVIE